MNGVIGIALRLFDSVRGCFACIVLVDGNVPFSKWRLNERRAPTA